jgi:hypothetical protein
VDVQSAAAAGAGCRCARGQSGSAVRHRRPNGAVPVPAGAPAPGQSSAAGCRRCSSGRPGWPGLRRQGNDGPGRRGPGARMRAGVARAVAAWQLARMARTVDGAGRAGARVLRDGGHFAAGLGSRLSCPGVARRQLCVDRVTVARHPVVAAAGHRRERCRERG